MSEISPWGDGPSYSEKRKRVNDHVKAVRTEQAPPTLYRADLFRRVKDKRYGSNVSTLGLKEISSDTGLAVNTVKAILAGTGSKIENIYRIARYFGVPWSAVFDVDKRFALKLRDDGTGFDIEGGVINPDKGKV